jgi:Zn finger protein HypA/HybF involved in hydrogenase expression
VAWPSSLSPEERARIAVEVRWNPLSAVKLIHGQFGFDLRDAKALAFHITRSAGECHRCHGALESKVSICPRCQSANLDW